MAIEIKGKTNYNPEISTSGMVLMLDASNKKSYPGSGDIWYDLSGFDNHASLNGAQYSNNYNGIIEKPIGTPSINIPDDTSLRFVDSFTLCIWAKFYNTPTYYRTLFGKPAYYNYGIIVEWYTPNAPLLADFTDVNNLRNGLGLLYPSLVDWNFITFSFDRYGGENNLNFYVFSKDIFSSLSNTLPSTKSIKTNVDPLLIGGSDLKIDVGSAYAYNRALSYKEVIQNYNAMKSRFKI